MEVITELNTIVKVFFSKSNEESGIYIKSSLSLILIVMVPSSSFVSFLFMKNNEVTIIVLKPSINERTMKVSMMLKCLVIIRVAMGPQI
jgi:hypothetical protein